MKHTKKVLAFTAASAMLLLSACGSTQTAGTDSGDEPVEITVWAWEKTYEPVVELFEKAHPNIKVKLVNAGMTSDQYVALNNAIAAGSGIPDVAQFEYTALQEYQINGALKDLTEFGAADLKDDYTPGTWGSVNLNGGIYGLPMDSGPMAFFYNKEVFDKAGVTEPPTTWDEYYEAAKKVRATGSYIATAPDAGFFDSMIWQAGGHPFDTAADGESVTINLTGDAGTKKFSDLWQKLLDEDLINTKVATWSDEWNRSLGDGSLAGLLIGAWMPTNLVASAPGAAGKWRVAQMPTWEEGGTENAENGGSALAVLAASEKAKAAYEFVKFESNNRDAIASRVGGGAFPSDTGTLSDEEFLNKTTVADSEGNEIDYFGGQKYNEVLAQAAQNVISGYKNLPFEVYARSIFDDNVAKAFDGSVTVEQGVKNWQDKLVSHAKDQGFTVKES